MASSDYEHGDQRKPLIGITTYLEWSSYGVWHTEGPVLPRTYVDATLAAGGVPMLLPPVGTDFRRIVDGLDGLVLSGGADVDPARYGQQPHSRTSARPDRDEYEFGLLAAALRAELPVLGVCRGFEVLNVAYGGTLSQHLPDVLGHDRHQPAPATFATSEVTIEPGSGLASVLGTRTTGQCHHHQGIDVLGSGLTAVAHTSDGLIEAVERPGAGFVCGVQWHPEEDISDVRLFAALVAAAADYATGKGI
ncbi:putative glutamine amidotransferase [Tamaricihabitans halophyticus]|uniref:Putative glutamine amidotransferase n=1 Tax=Tamaricihabitans halophyticus TaxID=1262583 RepID=A0A4V2SR10_9PSEU|nr:gamma-glutamyl-gamma-aminobutyrate hydrolase family protein [Tamaricihabitans halophyticus]TCP41116.1 putative glutamine amidotransferase [Tamaricihabitans halophyticus]